MKKIKTLLATISFSALAVLALGQQENKGTIKGKIIDQVTKEPVVGAAVVVKDLNIGNTTDTSGIFIIKDVPEGTQSLEVSEMGFQPKTINDVVVVRNKTYYLEIELLEDATALDQAVVTVYRNELNPMTPVSAYSFSREEIFRSPGSQGDIFRAVGILPGVISSGGQYSAIAVRGQGTTDNVYMVDDMPMFDLSHLEFEGFQSGFDDPNGGRFSIFAPRVIDNASFQGGGFAAEYGRKSSSYLGLGIKEGSHETPSVSGQFDLFGFTLIYDGPLTKNTTVFATARYQNFTLLAKLINYPAADPPIYSDYMIKTTTQLGAKNKLSFIAMYNPEQVGRTVGDIIQTANLNDINATTFIGHSNANKGIIGLNLQTLTSSNSYWKNVVYYRVSNVTNNTGESWPNVDATGEVTNTDPNSIYSTPDLRYIKNDQQEVGYRSIFTDHFSKSTTLIVGIDLSRVDLDYSRTLTQNDTLYYFYPTDFRPNPSQYYLVLPPSEFNSSFNNFAYNASGYADFSVLCFKKLTLNPGVRYDYTGFADQSTVSPRISGSYALTANQSINFSSGIYYQDPAEVDIVGQPDGHKLQCEQTFQNILGYRNAFSQDLKFVLEGWYKQFNDLEVRPLSGASYMTNDGTGYAYGADINLTKRLSKKYYGEIGYSYMVSKRDDHDGLGLYDYVFSRPNVISFLASYKPNEKWIFSSKFRYATGAPTDKYIVHANVLNDPNEMRYSAQVISKNGDRLADFISWDIRIDYKVQAKKTAFTAFLDVVDALNYTNQSSAIFQPVTGTTAYIGLAVFPSFGLRIER